MGDPQSPKSTSERIVDTARHIVQKRGFGALRYEQISDAIGIRRPSIHHHFRAKAELGSAVISSYTEEMAEKLAAIDAATDDPRVKLERYAALYTAVILEDPTQMCPGGMLAAEAMTLPPKVRTEVTAFFDLNERWLTGVLADAHERRICDPDVRVGARTVMALLQGALLLARLDGDLTELETATAQLGEWLWHGTDKAAEVGPGPEQTTRGQ